MSEQHEKTHEEARPRWLLGRGSIDEQAFCHDFTAEQPLLCVGGIFYSMDGAMEHDAVRHRIHQMITPYIRQGIPKRVRTLHEALKLYCYAPSLPLDPNTIHVRNGTLNLDEGYDEKKDFCHCRLNVRYIPYGEKPTRFLAFLNELLEPEDIATLQEYMGYCLIPCTLGQTALFVIGSGGEGKSRLGVVMQEIFGKGMLSSDFGRIEGDRFFLSRLVNKLVMVDDDMQLEAMKATGRFKALVTAETEMEVEEKGQQSYPARLYTRLICFGNGIPKTLYDKTEGFARRLIVLRTKPKACDRVDDPFLSEALAQEKEAIFRWMLTGLYRLRKNRFRFTMSQRARENAREAKAENCNIIAFLQAERYVKLEQGAQTTGVDLFCTYELWCRENAMEPFARNTFIYWLKENSDVYDITYSSHILDENAREVRGFIGIKAMIKTIIPVSTKPRKGQFDE